MIHDARQLREGSCVTADVCIVGAGAAGIAIARELIGSGREVCLLEAGGERVERASQALYRGRNVGERCEPLHVSRRRCFGGTMVDWTGRCRPLDPIDFEERDGIPHSGWPFGRELLEPFYRRAHELLELGPMRYGVSDWPERGAELELRSSDVQSTLFQYSPPTNFARAYRAELEKALALRVWLYASAVELESDASGERVTRLWIATPERRRASVSARLYILAAGGIENARLLLISRSHCRAGLGNRHDLVGRFFMEHPHVYVGPFTPGASCPAMSLYAVPAEAGSFRPGPVVAGLSPSAEFLRRERLLNGSLGFFVRRSHQARREHWSDSSASLERLVDAARRGEVPDHPVRCVFDALAGAAPLARNFLARVRDRGRTQLVARLTLEQAPDPSSRLTLSSRRDRFGLPTVALDWRLGDLERRSALRFLALARDALRASGLGEIEVHLDLASRARRAWPLSIRGAHHHMGTTRMHVDPRLGVVDEQCRVHGIENLYIAGSSVFPTCGYANPTLTLVALALRLADHVRAQLGV